MAKHAKHAAPPRRRRSAQKHTSHKSVTLYTLGVLLVAVSALLSLRPVSYTHLRAHET